MDEIEVTDEMLDAGEEALLGEIGGLPVRGSFDSRQFVKTIYRAMYRVQLSQIVPLVERVPICPGVTVDAGTIFVGTRARDPRDTITWKPKSD